MNVLDKIKTLKIVPVVVIDKEEDAVPLANAFLRGGIDVMEITLRTDCAIKAITKIFDECKEMTVGAGSVLNQEQCKTAISAGARFIVSPGFDENVIWCSSTRNCPSFPGCVTPTEIMRALQMEVHILKFFPANIYGGISSMKSLAAPFGNVAFIPTGGIDEKNLGTYLRQPFVYAAGGSWLCPRKEIAAGNFGKITELCKRARLCRNSL